MLAKQNNENWNFTTCIAFTCISCIFRSNDETMMSLENPCYDRRMKSYNEVKEESGTSSAKVSVNFSNFEISQVLFKSNGGGGTTMTSRPGAGRGLCSLTIRILKRFHFTILAYTCITPHPVHF